MQIQFSGSEGEQLGDSSDSGSSDEDRQLAREEEVRHHLRDGFTVTDFTSCIREEGLPNDSPMCSKHAKIRQEADIRYRKNAEQLCHKYSSAKRHRAERFVVSDFVSGKVPHDDHGGTKVLRLSGIVIKVCTTVRVQCSSGVLGKFMLWGKHNDSTSSVDQVRRDTHLAMVRQNCRHWLSTSPQQ